MNKMTKKILIAAIILCVIGGGLFFALKWNPDTAEQEESSDPSSSTVKITDIESDAVKSINIKNDHGSFTISSRDDDGTKVYFISEKTDIDFSQSMLSSAIYSISGLSGRNTAANISKKSDYGFDIPTAEAKITLNDDSQIIIYIGNESAVDSGRYVITDKSDTIYSVSSYSLENFFKTPNDFRNTDIASIDTTELSSIAVSSGGSQVIKLRKASESDNMRFTGTSEIIMEYPYLRTANTDNLSKLLESFTAVTAVDFPEISEKSCGFESGINIVLECSDVTHNITFGGKDENGNIYTKYNDLNYIFTTAPTMYNALLNLNALDYCSKFVHIFNIDEVNTITITRNGKTDILSIEHGEDDEKYFINGTQCEDSQFKPVYQSIIGISFTGQCSSPPGAQYATVVFEFTDGTSDTTTYYNYDDRNYCVKCSNGSTFLILKKNFDTAIDGIGVQ